MLIAGPNGAGKSTFAREYLEAERGMVHFINVDLIAAGLSPLRPGLASATAGRLLLKEFDRLVESRTSFALETTRAGVTYLRRLQHLKARGYRIEIIYLDLPTVEMAIRRVRARVAEGGHTVPIPDIRRRFRKSRANFLLRYRQLADAWWHYDNSGYTPRLVDLRIGVSSVRHIARAGKEHDDEGREYWSAVLARLPVRPDVPAGRLPHYSRFMSLPGWRPRNRPAAKATWLKPRPSHA